MLRQAGSSSPPLLQCSLLQPQRSRPQGQTLLSQWTHLPHSAGRLWVLGVRRAAHGDTSLRRHILTCSRTQRGAMSPSCRRAPLPLPHPMQPLIAHIDEPLMSFELTSSQINTLHVAGVGRGGTQSHWKNTRRWERRGSKGMGRREGRSTRKGPGTKKRGEAAGEWVVWDWLHPCCCSSFCKDSCSST